MNVNGNPPRRNGFIWSSIGLLGIFIIFLPGIIGLDGFDGGFALSAGGVFVAMMGIIAAVIYFRMGKILDNSLKPENVLAHWTYSLEQWKLYTEKDYKEDKAGKSGLFFLISAIAVVVGIIFWLIVRDDVLIILFIILGIIAVAGISAALSIFISHRKNMAGVGEAYITLNSLYLNNQLHIWQGIGNRLEKIFYEDSRKLPMIKLEYSAPNRGMRNYYTVRVPVPPGEENNAKTIVEQIKEAHPVKGM